MSSVQNYARELVVQELRNKLDTDLDIQKLHFQPFTTIELVGVHLNDRQNDTILNVEKLYANIDVIELLRKRLVINSVRLNQFDIHLSKETKTSPLNIQFVIDAFKSDNKKKNENFEVKLAAITLGEGIFSYDIKDQKNIEGKFDANHIRVSDLHARLALKSLTTDSINIQIKKLSLSEKSGFDIENLTTRIITQNKKLFVKGFKLDLPNSLLQFSRCEMDFSKLDSTTNLLNSTEFNCAIATSYIALKDVAAFVPEFNNFEDRLYLRASVSGSLADLKMDYLSLNYAEKMKLTASAEVKDVQVSDSTYVLGTIEEFYITSDGIEGLINNFSSIKKSLPKEVANLGTVSFRGDISGYLTELVAFGSLKTDIGTVTTDLLFGFKPKPGIDSYFNGKIATSDLNIGKLLNNKELNELSFDLSIDIEKPSNRKMKGAVEGTIHKFDFNNYSYEDIHLNGHYDGLKMDGILELDDENGYLAITGLFDLSDKEKPVLDFMASIENVRLDKLNLTKKYLDSYLSLNINANFTGKSIDDAVGALSIDSLRFSANDKQFALDELLVEASGYSENRKLKVKSDIINGEILGAYSFSTMIESIKQTGHTYLPALVPASLNNKKNIRENNLSLDFVINNTSELSDILGLPVTVLSPARITGFYNNIYEKFKFEIFFPSLKAAGTTIKSGYFVAENSDEKINSTITGIVAGKNNAMNELEVNLSAKNDIVESRLSFDSNGQREYKGAFSASTTFSRQKDKAALRSEISIHPGQLILNDSVWNIKNSHIVIDSSYVAVNNFRIQSQLENQLINIDGKFSPNNPNEMLRVDLKSINLEYVFNMLAIEALNFGGYATGTLYASTTKGKPYANVDLSVKDFKFNGADLGDLTLFGELDELTNRVKMKGSVNTANNDKTLIDGFINPITEELSINFDASKINIGFLNKYISTLFNNVSGTGSGQVHLFGDFHDVTVEGKAFIENGNLGINFLNTNYTFTDTIFLRKDLIYFNDIKFNDAKGNQANVSGKVAHNYFSDFLYHIDLSADNFLLYNATEQHNSTFFGTVFGSGTGSISGDEQALNIDVRMRTNENSKIRMNFMDEIVNEYSFITYKTPNDTIGDNKKDPNGLKAIKTNSGMEINMNFYIDATPDATVEIVMDPVGGDVLRGSGTGTMHFIWGSKVPPQLFGTYTIDKGNYNFTFQKILERKFSIQRGSSVQFRGDPFAANLDIEAVYKLTANLNDLDQYIAEKSGQVNVPVNCILNLTGELRHPNVNLDVTLPNADGEVQRQVKNLMNTEDMINRQVVYLLLLSKFFTPNYANAEHRTSDFASVASATLSTQLSKILSQIDDRWQVGTNIRTSDADFSSTEVELILSSNLLNDRLILNGNFGYRDDPNTQDAFIGDVDVEFLLNRAGNWRIKAYNHYNEKYYYTKTAIQTQGVGIMYKKDFDKISEFFGIEQKPKPAKKDSIGPILPDSIMKGSSLSNFVKIKK